MLLRVEVKKRGMKETQRLNYEVWEELKDDFLLAFEKVKGRYDNDREDFLTIIYQQIEKDASKKRSFDL